MDWIDGQQTRLASVPDCLRCVPRLSVRSSTSLRRYNDLMFSPSVEVHGFVQDRVKGICESERNRLSPRSACGISEMRSPPLGKVSLMILKGNLVYDQFTRAGDKKES